MPTNESYKRRGSLCPLASAIFFPCRRDLETLPSTMAKRVDVHHHYIPPSYLEGKSSTTAQLDVY